VCVEEQRCPNGYPDLNRILRQPVQEQPGNDQLSQGLKAIEGSKESVDVNEDLRNSVYRLYVTEGPRR
jgi:hypothetical protein